MALIPITKARLATSITIRASTPLEPVVTTYDATGAVGRNVPVSFGKVIGTVKALEREQTRTVTRFYTLGEHAFEPFRVVPGSITTTLVLRKVVLYEEDALEALGYKHGNLFYQQSPFTLLEEQYYPTKQAAQSVITRTVAYYDCWFTSNPVRYDVMADDLLVVQEVRAAVGKIACSDVTLPLSLIFKKSSFKAASELTTWIWDRLKKKKD